MNGPWMAVSQWEAPVVRQLFWGILALLGGAGAVIAAGRMARGAASPLWSRVWTIYLSWVWLLPLLVLPILLGQPWTSVAVMFLSLRSFREYARAVGLWKDALAVGMVSASIIGMNLVAISKWYGLFQVMPLYGVLLVFTMPLWRDAYEGMIQRVCLAAVGVVYFGWCLSHLSYLMNMLDPTRTHMAAAYVLTLVVLTELNDVGAFVCGHVASWLLKGRTHPLSPRLSPHKTVEGSLGAGLVTCGAAWALRGAIPAVTGPHLFFLGLLIWIGGTFGDLVISFIKRDVGVKDMGTLIPGHGGVLDRFDSLIYTTPLYFHYLRYFFGDTIGMT